MTSVSGDRVSRKVQLSAAASAIATILTSGAQLPDMCDFACELRLQCDLAALRHAAEIEGLQTLAPGVVEGNRAAGGLAPGGLGTAVLAGPQRHHDAVERHRGADRLVRYALGVTDAVQRLGAEGLPALVHGPCQALQGAHRRRHAADLRKERRRFPRRAVTPSSADRAEPPAASGNCQRRSKSTPLAGVKMHHLMRFSPALAVVPVVHRRDPRCFV